MAELQELSPSHCVLLAAHYATESNIGALQALATLREDDLQLGLMLRIILTFLPESADPSQYVEFLHNLASNARTYTDDQVTLDTSAVTDLSTGQARRKARRQNLKPLAHPLYQAESALDPLTLFLIHRAHQIDESTGLLALVPLLIVPFVGHSEYLRTWFISTVLPLLRLGYEYYPQKPTPSLETFAQLRGERAIDTELSNLRQSRNNPSEIRDPARDLRGVVGPWICGENERKRRKLDSGGRGPVVDKQVGPEVDDWECLFQWLVNTSRNDFPLVASAIDEWDGPNDLDLGGYDDGHVYIDEDRQRKLELRYAQTAMATLYLVGDSSVETLQKSHALLVRLTGLLGLAPPQQLNVGIESLPSLHQSCPVSQETPTSVLQDDHILQSDNPLTQPNEPAVRLLELFVFSACILSSLQYPISPRDIARMYLRHDQGEQVNALQKILHSLSSNSKRDGEQWKDTRLKLLWLWAWGTTAKVDSGRHGEGILGMADQETVETEILKALLDSGQHPLAIQVYIKSQQPPLPIPKVEIVVLRAAMNHYDNASNGNRSRGGMRRASDIVGAFTPYFPSSSRFQRTQALLSATHALSFYSLILQHGVPFQPVNIRVSADPLSLLQKLLSQNRESYTKLDDLVSIGQNLVVSTPSTLMDEESNPVPLDHVTVERKKAAAERRVIGMAVEGALEEDDFETAYSYVVNRLSPEGSAVVSPAASVSSQRFSLDSNVSLTRSDDDDVSWRAALLAGRYESSSLSASGVWSGSAARPDLRRLEQRMELLSQALLLAPPAHLEEVLSVWQQCEAEMTNFLADEADEEQKFNDFADRRLPGAFSNDTVAIQPRREVGRGAVEEAPMGLFDVARGAAAAFSKSAFPLRGNATNATRQDTRETGATQNRVSLDLSDSGSMTGSDQGANRARKRDMVANAVTGGLASGLGWVLGAKPAGQE
ncbi:secretory pathway Sec39 [Amniculicola lignicola CBS 123094]|uniref:Secretory pathway Sec39 n=1 Tax=Amniculicola lignicola CBS 123094 TaxID=1392246 RepID=A0A6A5W6E6_9PLEO|nr:secretory pathway Sec39 [Amniculicola lignicola CBS 123094]